MDPDSTEDSGGKGKMAQEGEKDMFEDTFQYESQVEINRRKILFTYKKIYFRWCTQLIV